MKKNKNNWRAEKGQLCREDRTSYNNKKKRHGGGVGHIGFQNLYIL